MIIGLGTDIIEIERIERANKNNRLAHRILTKLEMKKYNSLNLKKRQLEFLAGRFSGKEAYSKAKGTGLGTLNFTDIEILNDDYGKPYVNGDNALISISHSKEYATATVILLGKD